jgi:hypothetical protein
MKSLPAKFRPKESKFGTVAQVTAALRFAHELRFSKPHRSKP